MSEMTAKERFNQGGDAIAATMRQIFGNDWESSREKQAAAGLLFVTFGQMVQAAERAATVTALGRAVEIIDDEEKMHWRNVKRYNQEGDERAAVECEAAATALISVRCKIMVELERLK